jgi:epothilone polyketide synthase D
MESAGTVVRVGPDSDFEIGERVIVGLSSGGIRSFATFSPEDAFILRWGDLPLTAAESAVLPISFITAQYGLKHVGRLKEGERVLLHSATGGVGHAAMQVARATGARILATAGTEEKRAYLENMGLDAVFDSRTLDFEDLVLEATDGRGVDVVLNFLPDALLHASLRVLAPFGRLVEIGKTDIGANRGLPLADFERNLTFGAVDIDQMLAIRWDLFYAVAQEVREGFGRGEYQAIPVESRPADDVVEVFRGFAEGTHIGKRSLELSPGPRWALPRRVREPAVRANATYVVTGGHGGLGLETAKWLAAHGATHLVVVSRSAPESPTLDTLRKEARMRGGDVWSRPCDVGDAEALDALLEELTALAPPIRGVFHSAALLADGPVDLQTEEAFATAFHAKALGALNLHRSSVRLDLPLDHFVLFSSVSGMLGNAGQASYAAANVYLDSLAEHRRAQGLPATSIAWGAIAEAGMVARDEAVAHHLAGRGIQALPLARAFRCLGEVLAGAPPAVGAFDVRWDRWGETVVLDEYDPAASMVERQDSAAGPGSFVERFTEADVEDRLLVTQEFLKETLGRLLNLDREKVSLETTLLEMGVDSLMSVDLELALEAGLGSGSPLVQLNIQESLAGLSTRVVQKMSEAPATASEVAGAQVDVDALSDSEVDSLLKEFLDDPPAQARE